MKSKLLKRIFKAMKMIVVRNKETDNFQELETRITGAGCSQLMHRSRLDATTSWPVCAPYFAAIGDRKV